MKSPFQMIKSCKKSLFLTITRWMDEKKSPFFIGLILFIPSFIFRITVQIKNFLYEKKWLIPKRVTIPVVSIGNIIAGGAGKTPLVLELLKYLLEKKIKVGVISRGYLSKSEKNKKGLIGCLGKGPLFSSEILGDEPFLIAKRFPEIFLGIGASRYTSAKKLEERGVEVLVLDDGMQHRKLHRDVEIVVLHGEKVLGQKYFLPKGFLRDDPKRLKYADLIVVNHACDFTSINSLLKLYTKAPKCYIEPVVSGLYSSNSSRKLSLNNVQVGVFCAIADPKPFLKLLKDQGAVVMETMFGYDHENFSDVELQNFVKKCKRTGAEQIVCTEKDWVKLSESLKVCLPIVYMQIEIRFLRGKENWDKLMNRVVCLIDSNNMGNKSAKKRGCL